MMDNKQNILFLVHTEYHLIVCLSAIADKYNDPEKFNVVIWQTESKQKNRFQNINKSHLSHHITYKTIRYDENDFSYNANLNIELSILADKKYDELVIFNHHSFLAIYMAQKFFKLYKTNIILAPDGSKPYANITTKAPRWSFKYTLKFRRFLKASNLKYAGFYWPSLRYATLKEINDVWIHNPEHYTNHNNKTVSKIRVLETPESISIVNKIFNFDSDKELVVNENVYFHICLPPKDKNFALFDITFLNDLKKRHPDYTFMIKLHPTTNNEQVKELEKIEGCILINSHYPAELYIAKLKSSIVASYWSTASLINNTLCRFYWLHPLLKQKGIMLNYLNIINPTEHIIEVDSIEKIQ